MGTSLLSRHHRGRRGHRGRLNRRISQNQTKLESRFLEVCHQPR